MDPVHDPRATKVEMNLNGRTNDVFRPFILLPHLGVLGVLCGYASVCQDWFAGLIAKRRLRRIDSAGNAIIMANGRRHEAPGCRFLQSPIPNP